MTTRRTLTDLMDEVAGRNRDWSSPQDLGSDRATVSGAWLASDDPLAMLLLLAALHPRRAEEKCLELATALSFFEPMRVTAHTMSRNRGGMYVNGSLPFYFVRLYQRLRVAFRTVEDTRRSRLEPELAAAIRVVVHDPFTLVGPAA
ncbi:hypothetical protein [Pyxidicoccus xibeiensis]|uniref:hypothetical protein n=1 Tax=Pyxidicoccus xibeiensis TaxID=2906759 RepID=UPI0020A7025B|nr:hypothetical protein [Pyxidicoccus xibeiensis]MCP3138364.1 hypothetical protein [Pyxidicoccus xibeiensis]